MTDPHTMQCMEVWGGNQLVDCGVVMAGLDAWVYSRPYGSADGGGDIHYVSSCASGRITRLLVADVSGHGADVSQIATGLRSLMRRFVNFIDQTRFVRAMNEQFASIPASSGFATAVVSTYFAPTGSLSICNAGHPSPLVYRARSGEWSLLQPQREAASGPANMPLGVLDATAYDQFDTRLAIGDMVLCYTDSLSEAKDAGGALLGMEGLLKLVRELGPVPPAGLIPALRARLEQLAPGNLDHDDLTILLFRVNELAPRMTLRERLRAPWLVLRGILASLRRGGGPAPWPEMSLANIGGAIHSAFNRFARRARDASR